MYYHFLLQVLGGITFFEFEADMNNEYAFKVAVSKSLSSVTTENIHNFRASYYEATKAMVLATRAAVLLEYDVILATSKYSPKELASRLIESVDDGIFESNLTAAALKLGSAALMNATCETISVEVKKSGGDQGSSSSGGGDGGGDDSTSSVVFIAAAAAAAGCAALIALGVSVFCYLRVRRNAKHSSNPTESDSCVPNMDIVAGEEEEANEHMVPHGGKMIFSPLVDCASV